MLKYKQITKKDKCLVERDSAGLEAVNLELAHSPASNPPPPPPLQPSVRNFTFENRFCVQSKETFVLSGRILSRVYLVHFFFSHSPSLKEGERGVQAKTHGMFSVVCFSLGD